MTSNLCIGIDLGTTYSCAAVYRNGRVEIITNLDGNRTTPSVIAFTETGRLIGDAAKNQAAMNPSNTVYDVKRLIGQSFNSQPVHAELPLLSFKVEPSADNQPRIRIEPDRLFSPEELSAMVLSHLKEASEKYLGQAVTSAVITVPAYFNDAQRQATKTAGQIAGLEVLRIINEPTAAALAYGLERLGDLSKVNPSSNDSGRHIVVVDLGGGTFDCTLLVIQDGIYQVLATSGDLHLGGEDFDSRMVDFLSQEFKRRHKVDLTGNKRALRRLRNACEKAKRVLSSANQASIEIDALASSVDYSTQISRARFEELCSDLFRSVLVPIQKVLSDAKKQKNDIDEVILVGGSTRIPKIQALVSEFFDGKSLCTSINADESIAYGAAVQAALLSGQRDSRIDSMVLVDVCPLSIGIEVVGEKMAVVVPRNTTIPTERHQLFSTFADNQTSVLVQVFEGERQFTRDCRLLGKFHLEGIPPAPKGVPNIEVKFEIDANGILIVSAVEKSSGKSKNIQITNQRGLFSNADIERMICEAELYAAHDKAELDRVNSRAQLENYIWSIQATIAEQSVKEKLGPEAASEIDEIVKTTISWLDNNAKASQVEFEARRQQVEERCAPLMTKLMSSTTPSAPPSTAQSAPTSMPKFKPPKIEE